MIPGYGTRLIKLLHLGRALGIVPREKVAAGYMDIDRDDFAEDDPMKTWQEEVMKASHRVAVSWYLCSPVNRYADR